MQHNLYWGPDVQVSFNGLTGSIARFSMRPLDRLGECFCGIPVRVLVGIAGYDVTYLSNLDTHTIAEQLLRAKGFLSVGHDEYYSIEMFRNFQAAIARGLNVGSSPATLLRRILFSRTRKDARTAASSGLASMARCLESPDWIGCRWCIQTPTCARRHSINPVTVVRTGSARDRIIDLCEHGMKKGDSIPGW